MHFHWLLTVIYQRTHTDGVKSTSNHVSRLVFLFSCPSNPSINHLNFYCIKQIEYIFPCVCTVIDHRRRHSVYRTTVTPLDFVSCRTFLFFTRCGVICGLSVQHTHTERCNVFVFTKIVWNVFQMRLDFCWM